MRPKRGSNSVAIESYSVYFPSVLNKAASTLFSRLPLHYTANIAKGCFLFLSLVLARGRDPPQCPDPDRNLLRLIQQELGAKSPKTEPNDEGVEASALWG